MLWRYVKKYFFFAACAAMFMVLEVVMDLIQPELMSQIIDDGVLNLQGNGGLSLIVHLGLGMILLVCIGGLCGSLNNVFVHLMSKNVGNALCKDCFQKIMSFSFLQVEAFGSGSLVTRVTRDVTQVQLFITLFVRGMIRTFMLLGGSIFFLFRLNMRFGMVVLCATPWIVAILFVFLLKANPLYQRVQGKLDRINTILQEDIAGIRFIKACVKETHEKHRFQKVNQELKDDQCHVLTLISCINPIMNVLIYLIIAYILISGYDQVQSLSTTPGTIMAAVSYTTQLLNAILMLVMLFQNISRGLTSWGRIREVLCSTSELKEGAHTYSHLKEGSIEFQDVSFKYPSSQEKVLRHIRLSISPGESVAIMGATGCGKTSLIQLIPRFYDVSDGAVLVDGMDVRSYCFHALREKIAYVSQTPQIFRTSIKNNIAWGQEGCSEDEVRQAASIAQIDEFIQSTKEGYDTTVAQRGSSLSGGQKQRISIARALVRDAEILILDDATSALDIKTEAAFFQALYEARPKLTKLIITQRIATAKHADRIILLQNGSILAQGTHEMLMADCIAYQNLYHSQMEGDRHG